MNIVYGVPPKQPKNTWVSFDTEIFSLNTKQMHRPTSGKFGCLTICTGEDVYYIDTIDQRLHHSFDAIEDCVWVAQKSDFDITHLRRWTNIPPRKKLWDTMYIERIMWNGYYDGFSIADQIRRYLDIEVDKSLQKSFETATEMSPEQIQYACLDSYYTLQVAKEQKKVIDDKSFDVWKHIDLPALWAVLDFKGFAVDVDRWVALAEKNRQRQVEIDEQLPFNPRSHTQVKKWFAEHKIVLESSDEEHLQDVIRKNKRVDATAMAQMILESRMYGKRASTYGKDWVDNYIEYEDGVPVVYSEFDINRAETGRMASSSPNLQNVPVRETPEFRECFIARPGNSLVIADYSAQEPRVTAFLSQDKKFMEVFNRGEDIYIYMAKEIFHEDIKKGDPRRAQMKSLILGMTYGLSKYGLAKREGIDVETAEKLLTESFRLFPGVASWMEKQQKNKKYVTTVPGRKCWINPYSEQSKRNVLNSPIQGTAADMMKMAMGRLHEEWYTHSWGFDVPFGICAPIHDELILDVPTKIAQEVSTVLKKTMIDVAEQMCPGIKFNADIAIGSRWSEKH